MVHLFRDVTSVLRWLSQEKKEAIIKVVVVIAITTTVALLTAIATAAADGNIKTDYILLRAHLLSSFLFLAHGEHGLSWIKDRILNGCDLTVYLNISFIHKK